MAPVPSEVRLALAAPRRRRSVEGDCDRTVRGRDERAKFAHPQIPKLEQRVATDQAGRHHHPRRVHSLDGRACAARLDMRRDQQVCRKVLGTKTTLPWAAAHQA